MNKEREEARTPRGTRFPTRVAQKTAIGFFGGQAYVFFKNADPRMPGQGYEGVWGWC